MMYYNKKNAQAEYNKNIGNLDKNLMTWTTEEIKEFLQNGKEAIDTDELYLVALDYNSLIIVLKYLIKWS